ncbi:MAG: hypothetical protein ACK559_02485, partial [bacterium]
MLHAEEPQDRVLHRRPRCCEERRHAARGAEVEDQADEELCVQRQHEHRPGRSRVGLLRDEPAVGPHDGDDARIRRTHQVQPRLGPCGAGLGGERVDLGAGGRVLRLGPLERGPG